MRKRTITLPELRQVYHQSTGGELPSIAGCMIITATIAGKQWALTIARIGGNLFTVTRQLA